MLTPQAPGDWTGLYDLTGGLQIETSYGAADIPMPSTMEMSWLQNSQEIMLYGQKPLDSKRASTIGILLGVSNERAGELKSLYVIEPTPDFKQTVTYGFVLASPLPLLSAAVGSSSTASTENGWFQLRVARTTERQLRIDVAPGGGTTGQPWFRSGSFLLDLSSWMPPWPDLNLKVETDSDSGRVHGVLTLHRSDRRHG